MKSSMFFILLNVVGLVSLFSQSTGTYSVTGVAFGDENFINERGILYVYNNKYKITIGESEINCFFLDDPKIEKGEDGSSAVLCKVQTTIKEGANTETLTINNSATLYSHIRDRAYVLIVFLYSNDGSTLLNKLSYRIEP